ncbi:hypothetical protein IWW36_005700 [Coemansia brasiliensis]|uniref:HIT domain-containing protein n=1 Tax=Coemansia brasiliensis TaxID=2650707 RepID=A0A9W8I141_9FUNG|nr:hypothetical protein IWW36_005700 [Coemansia brasiliensis]
MLLGRSVIFTAGAFIVFASGYLIMRGQKRPKHCVFCHPLERVVYEDENFIAFHDIKPDAQLHLLVIPRKHYGTIKELSAEDMPMVKRMYEIGQQLLEERGFIENTARFGFHRPPFNSIHHLHLHCLGLPFKSRAERMFPKNGSLWFMPAENLITAMSDQSN